MKSWMMTIAALGIGVLCAPAFGANPARPGTVNYVEGSAYLEGKLLNSHDVGTIEMNPGQVLKTGTGKAEILLTPGVFLRLDDHSALKMVAPDLTPTQVELVQGRAAVEVDQIFPQNDLQMIDGGVTTHLTKTGYYEFDANHPMAMVFQGNAVVDVGDGKFETVKTHHETALQENVKAKSVDFDSHGNGDDLYGWSKLRSQYLA
jgi:hypothetical protein